MPMQYKCSNCGTATTDPDNRQKLCHACLTGRFFATDISVIEDLRSPVGSTFDPARHPEHYHEGKGIDPIGVMRETFNAPELEGFFKGSALKYIMRYQSKNGKQDLEKAKFYVEQLISLYTGEVPNGNETK